MDDLKKQKLFPLFAYEYSKELNPERYSTTTSPDDWMRVILDYEEDMDTISEQATYVTDQEWLDLDKKYNGNKIIKSQKGTKISKDYLSDIYQKIDREEELVKMTKRRPVSKIKKFKEE